MPNIGYVNGRFLPLEEACVSVEDRGFQFGDGVYEVIRVYGGKPFRLKEHLSRLERSARRSPSGPSISSLPGPYPGDDRSGNASRGLSHDGRRSHGHDPSRFAMGPV